jgi:hypothetical protein
MTLDQLKARDQRAREALIAYSRGDITETTCRDALRACGWGPTNVEKIIDAVKNNLIKIGG